MVVARDWYCGRGGIIDGFGGLGLDVVGVRGRIILVTRGGFRVWRIGGRTCHRADDVTFTYRTCAAAGGKPGGAGRLVSLDAK